MMQLTERHIIKKSHKLWKELDNLSFLSKNLYNATLYLVRQHYFETGGYLNYNAVNRIMIDSKNLDYYNFPSRPAQQIQMQIDNSYRGYFQALKQYQKHPELFDGMPRSPQYKDKINGRNILTYGISAINKMEYRKTRQIKLSKTNIIFKSKIPWEQIDQVRIIPGNGIYTIELIYTVPDIQQKEFNDKCAGVDLGVNNLVTLVSNIDTPKIFNGKPLKSINQFYNKKRAQLQSQLPKGQYNSKQIQTLTNKRNNKIHDYMHKTSRKIINYLVSQDITKLVIGKNTQWKQRINIGRRNNQNFVSIPFNKLIQQIQYKTQLQGIEVILINESYTSKCSFLDNESIKKHETYQGKRIKRGLFQSNIGKLLNADVNGAANILKKEVPNAFAKGIEVVVVRPVREEIPV